MSRIFLMLMVVMFPVLAGASGYAALNAAKMGNNNAAKEKAQELEAVYLAIMMEPMFPKGKESNLYGGGAGSDVYRMLMLQEYGNIMAQNGGIGLAEAIEKQILQKREQ